MPMLRQHKTRAASPASEVSLYFGFNDPLATIAAAPTSRFSSAGEHELYADVVQVLDPAAELLGTENGLFTGSFSRRHTLADDVAMMIQAPREWIYFLGAEGLQK